MFTLTGMRSLLATKYDQLKFENKLRIFDDINDQLSIKRR